MSEELWVDKYRPKTVENMCLKPALLEKFKEWQENPERMPHMTLAGVQGTGKTTLARILAEAASEDILYVHCGKEGGVDDIRTKVVEFCKAMSFDGRNKTVIFDEADGLSKNAGNGSSAQDALRGIIEESQHDTRFILTCNYINKLIPALVSSRCRPIDIRFSESDVLKKCVAILDAEEIKYTKETIMVFYERVIRKNFPDIRGIINVLYLWVTNGELIELDITSDSEVGDFIDKLIGIVKAGNLNKARQLWLDNEALFCSYEELSGAMFNSLEDIKQRMIIGKFLREFPHVLDKEIQFTCLIMELFFNK